MEEAGTKMPEFSGRAESEGGKSGRGADMGRRMAECSGEAWALSWVGHLDPLQNDGLGGGGGGGGGAQRMSGSYLFLSLQSRVPGGAGSQVNCGVEDGCQVGL